MQVKTAGFEVLQRRIEPGQETMSWIVQAESRSNSKRRSVRTIPAKVEPSAREGTRKDSRISSLSTYDLHAGCASQLVTESRMTP